ncbi:MAG: APC family permease [Gemmatimonadota bacterium]|nr:APC family permease [Gemmatimonadota bacterium]
MLAKSASATTAALSLAGYLLDPLGVDGGGWHGVVAVSGTIAITGSVAGGIRRSNRSNALVVGTALLGLVLLVATALPVPPSDGLSRFTPLLPERGGVGGVGALLHGSTLTFVAYTGYGRIATLGKVVRDPGQVIPRAILLTVGVVTVLYLGVAASGVGGLGADGFGEAAERTAAPLERVAEAHERPWLAWTLGAAAVAAMAGVLLNLVLGLSRVLLAMARRGDAPDLLARIDGERASPVASVWA